MKRDCTSFAVTAVLWLASLPGVLLAQVENVAPRGIARQSTGHDDDRFPASNAIDGNLDDFTHTSSSGTWAMWQLDLGQTYVIDSVVLHNRRDCCAFRLRDITVAIRGEYGIGDWSSESLNVENELGGRTASAGPSSLTVNPPREPGWLARARYVTVYRTPDPDNSGIGGGGTEEDANVLSLAEVEVFGTRPVGVTTFRRGDVNRDLDLDTTDPVSVLNWLFLDGPVPACMDAADVDDSGTLDITDSVYHLNYAFLGGSPPLPPGPHFCGPDPTLDDLGCDRGCP